MTLPELLDNCVRWLLVLATIASFAPQIRRVMSQKSCDGICLYYVLFITISAAEQFTIFSHFLAFHDDYPSDIVHLIPTLGDWLNWCQFAVMLLCSLVFFVLCIRYSPPRDGERVIAITMFVMFALASLVPLAVEVLPPVRNRPQRDHGVIWFSFDELFLLFHILLVNIGIMVGLILSLFSQAAMTGARYTPGALSTTGLGVQAVFFVLVGVSWMLRLHGNSQDFFGWYALVGWAAIDNILLGIVQAVVFVVATCIPLDDPDDRAAETRPLLAS
ncbi:hypothetical protein GQ53DRAFT_823652 [Thozetella sp. PMI_491]|nr:hypothetical protein GQ53DRAFT_823652 [Thozetella sp. PMI_491]